MKKLWFVCAVLAVFMLAGCATIFPLGTAYTGGKFPMMATANTGASTRTGEAQCMSVLGLVAAGDCSIEAAKRNGGITKVNNVDWEVQNILGVYGTYKVIVSGE